MRPFFKAVFKTLFKPVFKFWGLPITLILLLAIGFINLTVPPAFAAIRQLEEAPGQLLYQSRYPLRDEFAHSWQVIFFKRIKPHQETDINLRLVGFPGTTEFLHPQPLKIQINSDESFLAADLFAKKSPAANVGQYNLKPIFQSMTSPTSWQLSVEMADHQILNLKVPLAVVLEWQDVAHAGELKPTLE